MENADKTRLSKKKSITILVSLFVVAILLTLLNMIDFDAIINENKKQPEITDYGYSFYEPDYDTDIFSDPEYIALNRDISYQSGGLTISPADLNEVKGASVIADYLDAMMTGNAEKYSSLFTNEYISEKKDSIPSKFPQQRLYEIKVVSLSDPHTYTKDELEGKYTGVTRYLFQVVYYIQYNSGTVRRDIPSDASRPLYFEVFEYPNGQQKINSMLIYNTK